MKQPLRLGPTPSVTRRSFLRTTALAAAGLALGPAVGVRTLADRAGGGRSPAREPRAPRQKVVVVGAGLAGLAAALELEAAGHEAVVLEAQHRPGGRVLTLRDPFSDGLHGEAGAARVPRAHDTVRRYCERFGLELGPFMPPEPRLLHVRGEILKSPGFSMSEFPLPFTREEREIGLSGLGGHYFGPPLREIGDPTEPGWPPSSLGSYDGLTLVELLRRRGASEATVALFTAGSDLGERYSALEILMHAALSSPPFDRILGGADRLPRAMADRLGDRVRYGRVVERIERGEEGVRVRASVRRGPGGGTETVEADRAVVTLPFSVLRSVEAVPPFSRQKSRAIRSLRYEECVRVFVETEARFWEEEGLSGFALTDDPMEIWNPSAGSSGTRGLLMAYLRGTRARTADGLEEEAAVARTTEAMAATFPGLPDQLRASHLWSWQEAPWALGAYSFYAPGEMLRYHHAMAEPEGPVHFAGAHTTVWPGWMEGALASGLRAAREVERTSLGRAGAGAIGRAPARGGS